MIAFVGVTIVAFFAILFTERYPRGLFDFNPERLSRGLVLVKWWLLAIPHYLVLAFFHRSRLVVVRALRARAGYGPGLIGLLVLFTGVVLLFRGFYPRSLYRLIFGMDSWVARVIAYATLMRDEYPPFRLGP